MLIVLNIFILVLFLVAFVILFRVVNSLINQTELVKKRIDLQGDIYNETIIEFSNIKNDFGLLNKVMSGLNIDMMNLQSKFETLHLYSENLAVEIENNAAELDTSLSFIESRIRQAEELFIHLSLDNISVIDFKERVKTIYANYTGEDQQVTGMESELETGNVIQDEAPTTSGCVSPTIAEAGGNHPETIQV